MRIQVHIERLVLDGLPVDRRSAPLVQAAVEAELSRLVAENGFSSWASSGGALASLGTAPIRVTTSSTPACIGHAIAQSLHGGLVQ